MANLKEHRTEKGDLVFRFDRKKKAGEYHILESDSQKKLLSDPILLVGFDSLPSGFYREGYGLTGAGNFIVQEIHKRYRKVIELTVVANGVSRIDARGKKVKVTILHQDLARLGQTFRTIKRERNDEMRIEAQQFLGAQFKQFSEYKDAEAGYTPGQLAEVISNKTVINKLSDEDRKALELLIPEYLSSIQGTLRAKKKLQVVFDALDAGKKIYLDKVLKEFRVKLGRRVQNEQIWQDFLSNYILLVQSSYGEVLEKESVSLQGKFPDFMLVDPYGYLDIYEIKKPSTTLVKFDSSRNNYYWDVELSKAIAQVENYIHQAQRHADSLANDIRKAKSIDVSIVRPRGFIIAGKRTQLTSSKMKDDFRILCESLKNVDVILYDDLLESLEAFIARASA